MKEDNKQNKLEEIVQGWKNLVFKTPEAEELAKKRAEVCAGCDYNVLSVCVLCGCPLAAKLRSKKTTCPKKKW